MIIFKNFLIALDQAINCMISIGGEWGQPDEMLSARAYRKRETHPQYERWINRIFFWDRDHCRECYGIEKQKKQLPEEYRHAQNGQ